MVASLLLVVRGLLGKAIKAERLVGISAAAAVVLALRVPMAARLQQLPVA
jgi:hypothetical protein